jgi:hypothetical protein
MAYAVVQPKERGQIHLEFLKSGYQAINIFFGIVVDNPDPDHAA